MDKISVIVPVYKVEPYLRKCLDSIVGQSYQNLEIILVDDGSPDNCGDICEEYAAGDERIRVIHQKNGGLSAARNTGLSVAGGAWIGFVDSDDWIEPDMFDSLLDEACRAGADGALCGHKEVYGDREVPRVGEKRLLLDREGAMELLLRDEMIQSYVWNKLFRRELWEGVRFPEGRTYEDIAVTYRLFERADKITYLPEAKYNYRQRQGSIVADISLKNRLNCYRAMEERYMELAESWPQFQELLRAQQVAAASGLWTAYFRAEKSFRQQMEPRLQEISAFCRPNIHTALAKLDRGLAGRLIFRLTAYPKHWAYGAAYLVSWLYARKHGRGL